MWIPRDMERLLLRRASQRPVVILTGARQTGKTTLVRRVFPENELVSLDLPSEAEQAERDPSGFLSRHPPPLIVDEVQYAPGLLRHIKMVVDGRREDTGLFILTGSQKLTLMQGASESLAGRADVLELEGLSFAEIRAAGLEHSVEEVLVRGSFPELYQKPQLDADGFYRSYVATYLERDLRQLLQVSSLRDYERFLRACALRGAQLLNKAELARDVGISASTAAQWISVLQATNQVALLEPWFSNATRTLVKTPKLYLCDTGLAAFLMGLTQPREIHTSPFRGALWESLVFAEIRRLMINQRGGWNLNFWRDRTREADFLFHRAGRFDLADAKWTEHPSPRDAAILWRVASLLPKESCESLALICRAAHPFPLSHGVRALPLGHIGELIS